MQSMSEGEARVGGVVDKRPVVRVGLSNRSSLISTSSGRIAQAQPVVSNQYQFVKGPVNEQSVVRVVVDDKNESNQHDVAYRHLPYRKLYSDLSDGRSVGVNYKVEEDSSDGHITQDSNDTSDDQSTTPMAGRTYQIITADSSVGDEADLQPLALKNISTNNMQNSGATVVQYTQDGQLFIPVHQLSGAPSLVFPPGLMVSSAGTGATQQIGVEESCKKRELRLLKNKEAAKECRRKKKEYVKCLENRVAVLENQNKTLIEELKSLKELYCQKDIHS